MDLIVLQGGGGSGGGGGFGTLLMMVGLIVIMYFFMIRPQMKRQKKEKEFRQNLSKGDRIITVGGLHGKITQLDEKTALVQLDEGFKVRMERSAIRSYAEESGKEDVEDPKKAASNQ